jgi:hypothetical protein
MKLETYGSVSKHRKTMENPKRSWFCSNKQQFSSDDNLKDHWGIPYPNEAPSNTVVGPPQRWAEKSA